MPRNRFGNQRVGPHSKVRTFSRSIQTWGGGPEGSGAFGCWMERQTIQVTELVCVSTKCGAKATWSEGLEKIPHVNRQK